MRPTIRTLLPLAFSLLATIPLAIGDEPTDETKPKSKPAQAMGLDAWKDPQVNWEEAGGVDVDPKNDHAFVGKPGSGVFFNGPGGRALNLISKEEFGDVEVTLEFNVPKGSNSGIKLQGVYEIQIFDSYGAEQLDGASNGGVYPRAEMFPKYHHIDDGYAPKVNASLPPGEWQTLKIVFEAPKFDDAGKKTADARFVKVVLNGKLIHENREVPTPTGHVWRNKENPKGPILLQGDHGPVAFREVRVQSLSK